jgi:O-antigen/teichoic acid export membrane protein
MKLKDQPWIYSEASLEKSFLWSLAITALPVASSFVVSWVVARWAGPEIIGTVSWVMAFATACLIVGKFGIGMAASRLASEYGVTNPANLRRLLKAGIQLRLLFTISVASCTLILSKPLAGFFRDPSLSGPIQVGSLIIIFASIYEFNEHFLVGLNRFAVVYRVRLIHHLARIAITVLIVALGFGALEILSGYCLAWFLALGIHFALLFRFLPKTGDTAPGASVRKRLFLASVPLAVSGASVAIYSQMDKIMLGFFCDMGEVGQYTIARNVVEVSLFPVFALIMALRPALASRFSAGAVEECSSIVRKTLFLSLISGVLFSAVFALMGRPLIVLVFSEHFSYAGGLMLLFSSVIAMRSLGAVILPALVAAERMKAYAYLTLASAISNFVLNLALIPHFRARGAIVATVISYGFLLLFGLYIVLKTFNIKIERHHLGLAARVLFSGAAACVILRIIFPSPLPQASVLLWVIVLVILYTAFLFVLRVVERGDLRDLISSFK